MKELFKSIKSTLTSIESERDFLIFERGRMGRDNEDAIDDKLAEAEQKIKQALELLKDAYSVLN